MMIPLSAQSLKVGCLQTNAPLAPLMETLLREEGYAVVHRSREDLAAPLEEVFRRWVREGRWQQEMDRIISEGPGEP